MLFVKQEMVDAAANGVNDRREVLFGVRRLVYAERRRAAASTHETEKNNSAEGYSLGA
jgi:hypothetical protein